MKQSYNDLVKRIEQFSMSCDIKDENGVVHHFHHGHEYVEIGGLKWATMNVGAEKPTDNGLYFAWGETKGYSAAQVGTKEGKKAFIGIDYKWSNYDGTTMTMTKYNSIDGKTTLDAEDDGVAVNWGGKWRMPTTDEFSVLCAAVNTVWTNNYKSSGVKGLVCTAKDGNGAELFFPAASYCSDGRVRYVGSLGFYWSSLLNSSGVRTAYNLCFRSWSVNWQVIDYCFYGHPLRGVVGE